MLSVKSLWKSTMYKMKSCKIKWHFSIFAFDRALTTANTDLAFLGFWESFSLPFFPCLFGYSELPGLPCWGCECRCDGQQRAPASKAAAAALCWAAARMCWALRKHCFRCLWVPCSWDAVLSVLLVCGEGSGSFKSVCELLKRQTVCLKIWVPNLQWFICIVFCFWRVGLMVRISLLKKMTFFSNL